MVCAALSRSLLVRAGCLLTVLLELCRGPGDRVAQLSGNVTSDGLQSSHCFRTTRIFGSVTSPTSKAALDFNRIKNYSSGTTLFKLEPRGVSLEANVLNTLRIFAGAGGGDLRQYLDWAIPAELSPVRSDPLTTCKSVLEIAQPGQWTLNTTGTDREWQWSPAACKYRPPSALELIDQIKQQKLTDLAVIGSSRDRTIFYDLISLLAPNDKFTAEKAHHALFHHVHNNDLNLKLYFHSLDCSLDIPKGTRTLNTYSRTMGSIGNFLQNNSLCSYSATDPAVKQVVVFSTGICEADRARQPEFEQHLPTLLTYMHEQCHRARSPNSRLVFKSEESVDPSLRYFDDLSTFDWVIAKALANVSAHAFVNTLPIGRSYKIYNDSADGVHYYGSRPFVGNEASATFAKVVLQAALEQGGEADYRTALRLAVESTPHTTILRSHPLDGTLVAAAHDKKTIFAVINGVRRPIPDWDTFLAFGADWSEIIILRDEEFHAIPLGASLPSASAPLPEPAHAPAPATVAASSTPAVAAATAAPVLGCNVAWPLIDIQVPVNLNFGQGRNIDPRRYEFEGQFLRTFLFFWPLRVSNVSMTLIYDDDKHGSPMYNEIAGTVKGVESRIFGGSYMKPVRNAWQNETGNIRMQMAMFWADNYTERPFIGLADTDAAFITFVDVGDLFEDGKPVVNGRSGYHKENDGWEKVPWETYKMTGILQAMRCMSYFPVVIKREHFAVVREYLLRFHGDPSLTFDQLMARHHANGTGFWQFDVFCSVLWTVKRDEYVWYVHSETPDWDGKEPPPRPGQSGNVSVFTAQMHLPKPRIATHTRYRTSPNTPKEKYPNIGLLKNRPLYNLWLQSGYCESPPFPKLDAVCLNRTSVWQGYYHEMHAFEYFDWAKTQPLGALRAEFSKRQARIANCTHEWDPVELKLVLRPAAEQGNGWRG